VFRSRRLGWFIRRSVLVALCGVLLFVVGETAMRGVGRTPWRPHTAWDMRIEPGGLMYRGHDTLGFTHCPGQFTLTFPDGYLFHMTNDEDGHRITRPLDGPDASGRPRLWVFGCSFTYGLGIEDHEAFPWLVQAAWPDYDIINFAQSGYGTVQSLIQLREALRDRTRPRMAVLTYASFHDMRNALLWRWRKGFSYYRHKGPLQQPYARLRGDGSLAIRMSSAEYRGWPLMRHSALVHSLEQKCDLLLERHVIQSHEVSKALVREFARTCADNSVALVVAIIGEDTASQDMLVFCRRMGIPAVDISVDYHGNLEYNLLPHDNHPNAAAHEIYARKLNEFLAERLDQE